MVEPSHESLFLCGKSISKGYEVKTSEIFIFLPSCTSAKMGNQNNMTDLGKMTEQEIPLSLAPTKQ